MVDQKKETSRRTGRSPAYPSFDLKEALAKAKILFDAEQRHPAPYPTIVRRWGYSEKSGPGRLAFATLKKFGLIEQVGTGGGDSAEREDHGQRGEDPPSDNRPNNEERKLALQAAALRPAMHRKLWEQYKGSLPSDENLIYQLRPNGFTEVGARGLVDEFRSTLAFAQVTPSVIISPAPGEGEGSDDDDDDDGGTAEVAATATEEPRIPAVMEVRVGPMTTKPQPTVRMAVVGPHLRLPLAGDNVLEVSLRSRVTRREFEKIKQILDLAEDSFVEPDAAP